ncbi:MAG: cold shock domain-containing protein [Gammaproteobacteria bacterium]|nr:MAG: cold shock domain-containing protein [Gammaproteobacteria bacterium]
MRYKGKVKWFNVAKGFGFIESESLDNEILVRYTDIESEGFKVLEEGDAVEFDILKEGDRDIATEVTKV